MEPLATMTLLSLWPAPKRLAIYFCAIHTAHTARTLLGVAMLAGSTLGSTGFALAATGALNDTGITFCGDDTTNTTNCAVVGADGGTHPRQDATQGRDAQAAAGTLTKVGGGGAGFDFTKIANNGTVLPASAELGSNPTDWACTRDNVTGLIWEVKTISGLRSQDHRYTWYNRDASINGGAAGIASGGTCFQANRCDTEKFVQDVNAAPGLCGATDWRMPTVKELESIADFGRFMPSVDPTYFPNTPYSSYFWSASAYASGSSNAWNVDFGVGNAHYSGSKSYAGQARLVRAGQ
jgi:hypothetical protein